MREEVQRAVAACGKTSGLFPVRLPSGNKLCHSLSLWKSQKESTGPEIYAGSSFSISNPVNLTVNVKIGCFWKVK